MGEILDLGVEQGFIDKSGSWYSLESERIGQGRRQAELWLAENPESAQKIETAIRGALLPDTTPSVEEEIAEGTAIVDG